MATCMQHLFMIPQARKSVLEARVSVCVCRYACYMATCMQHLFMIPQARMSVLEARVRVRVCV